MFTFYFGRNVYALSFFLLQDVCALLIILQRKFTRNGWGILTISPKKINILTKYEFLSTQNLKIHI